MLIRFMDFNARDTHTLNLINPPDLGKKLLIMRLAI